MWQSVNTVPLKTIKALHGEWRAKLLCKDNSSSSYMYLNVYGTNTDAAVIWQWCTWCVSLWGESVSSDPMSLIVRWECPSRPDECHYEVMVSFQTWRVFCEVRVSIQIWWVSLWGESVCPNLVSGIVGWECLLHGQCHCEVRLSVQNWWVWLWGDIVCPDLVL